MAFKQDQKFFTVKDVPAMDFIREFANHLKKTNKITIPKWVDFVKTGINRELSPYDEDWLYIRIAAVARKIYLRSNTGVGSLRHFFGGKQRNGTVTPRHEAGSGKLIRWALQELAKIEYVKKDKKNTEKKESRTITKAGQTHMNRIATNLATQKRD